MIMRNLLSIMLYIAIVAILICISLPPKKEISGGICVNGLLYNRTSFPELELMMYKDKPMTCGEIKQEK